ncbi:membrane protein [Nakamurella panacisegetis]|uniref:Membrane protein n=1 Tax=Nakamurella panacisegetis TaxID=1090615 RepID=A0A1H0QEF0_9ACTN|nr:YihY/virulence factor BrkB family protein [Nakamurella panacisegetis]SDP15717.1 membrane protein [Nakamurella panacisegetis]
MTSARHSDDERSALDPSARGGPRPPAEARYVEDGSSATVALHRPDPTADARPTGNGRTTSAPSPADNLTVPWHRLTAGPVPVPTGPVPTADGPVRHRWRKVAVRTMSKAWSDSLFGMSSQAAFWCALSTAPLLLALLGLVGFVAPLFGADTLTQIEHAIFVFLHQVFNKEVADNLVGNTVKTILGHGRSDVVSVGLVISLWAGSSAMSAFVEAITIAYGQHEIRHPIAERFFALGLYLMFLVAGIFGLPILAIGPEALPKLFPESWQSTATSVVNIAYYPALAVGLLLLLTSLYKVAPKHRHAWKRGLPGAVLAAVVFFVASFGLRLYLTYVYAHGLTYGALATPITFLLFYYFISMAIIIGAQFNNALLEYYPPKRPKRELRRWQKYDPARHPADAV